MQYMKKYIKNIVPATFMMLALGATSCIGDLDEILSIRTSIPMLI